jgi:D-serine deaminase-like pyridoxal phosphate-dependent protein
MADCAREGNAGTVPSTHLSRPGPGCVLAVAGSRLAERDAAAAGAWLERNAEPRGVEAVDQPSEQREFISQTISGWRWATAWNGQLRRRTTPCSS